MIYNKKILIKSRAKFDLLKKMVTRDVFYKNFELAMNVVSEITAEDAMINLYFEDSRLPTAEEFKKLKECENFKTYNYDRKKN